MCGMGGGGWVGEGVKGVNLVLEPDYIGNLLMKDSLYVMLYLMTYE